MKNIAFLLSSLIVFWLGACSQASERGVRIGAEVEGLQAGELVYYAPEGKYDEAKYVPAEAGRFSLQIPIAAGEAEWYEMWIGSIPKPEDKLLVFLDSGVVNIKCNSGGLKSPGIPEIFSPLNSWKWKRRLPVEQTVSANGSASTPNRTMQPPS
ncbi:hypothetical protein WJU16_04520 [Chitinophaga pollutisoli]|uniref:DUF4369 domain-containing protein n=1 Tax=Chitinophaga pollutisoli TaxID=3133966 RepID=A0ABZ2YSF1_9BACT